MPWSCLVLMTVVAVALAAEPAVLTTQGEGHAAVVHALHRVSVGDTRAMDGLDPSLAGQAIGLTDPRHANIVRRWTWALADAMRAMPQPQRERIASMLDQWMERRGDTLAAALDAVAAPRAASRLAKEAARAFDHGRFAAWMELAEFLPQDDALRRSIAVRELAGAPIPLPALPRPVDGPLWRSRPSQPPTFKQVAGWLLRLDSAGRTRWQVPLTPTDAVAWDEALAAVRGERGLELFSASGPLPGLPPLPGGVRLLGVAGSSAWLHIGTAVWRIGVDRTVSLIDLPFVPLMHPSRVATGRYGLVIRRWR